MKTLTSMTSLNEFSPARTYDSQAATLAILDRWVAAQGNGCYVDPSTKPDGPYDVPAEFGIQQVREEIGAFVETVLGLDRRANALEIGLGFFGSTHFLWRLLFDRVFSVEKSLDRCRGFNRAYQSFSDGHWAGSDGRSGFIYGFSSEPGVVRRAYQAFPDGVDLLFIDGDHSYAGVMCDWLLYRSLVRKGGIIAFHDIVTPHGHISEVARFIDDLEAGRYGRDAPRVERIVHSEIAGIGFCRV
jgi:predicted O-methyltransferase YrrM